MFWQNFENKRGYSFDFSDRPAIEKEEEDPTRVAIYRFLAAGDLVNEDSEFGYTTAAKTLRVLYQNRSITSLAPALPLLLRLRGEPFTLNDHFMMEPVFSSDKPKSLVLKCGRQVSKTQSVAADSCLTSALVPYFRSLYVAPRFEQTRRFSNDYIRPLILESPIGKLMAGSGLEQSVLKRVFRNNAIQYFSYAFLDCERIRGISADKVIYDEAQDIDPDFIDVINETMSHSKYAMLQFCGTPKTLDNNLQYQFDRSSQAEWVIHCDHCGYWNICSVDYDLLKLIKKDGVSCAKCEKLVDPRGGHWEHRYSDRMHSRAGYHVPQLILPIHYANREKWLDLYNASINMDRRRFYNEKLGEAFDTRLALVTKRDLIAASNLKHQNDYDTARELRKNYIDCTLGVDWGGGGEEGISYTAIAILGHRPDGTTDLLYGTRLSSIASPVDEAKFVVKCFREFRCSAVAHDFGGSGGIREILLVQAGLPMDVIFPVVYVRSSSAKMVTLKAPSGDSVRTYYSVDKARSLVLLCQLITHSAVHFPKFDSWETLSDDFLALVEDRIASRAGSDVYLVTRKSGKSDDFVHALNYAHLCYWERNQRYPNLASQLGIRSVSAEDESEDRG